MEPHPLTYEELETFIDQLRRHGYPISTEQFMAAQRLLVALAASGHALESSSRPDMLLAPVFCTSPEEQQSFYNFYEQWLTMRQRTSSISPILHGDIDARPSLLEPRKTSSPFLVWLRQSVRARPRSYLAFAAILIFVIGVVIYRITPKPPSPSDQSGIMLNGRVTNEAGLPLDRASVLLPSPEASPRPFRPAPNPGSHRVVFTNADGYFDLLVSPKQLPAELVISHPDYKAKSVIADEQNRWVPVTLSKAPLPWWWILFSGWRGAMIVAGIVMACALICFRKFRREAELKKWRTRRQPEVKYLNVEWKGRHEYLSRIMGLRRAAQQLRRHRQSDSTDLNVEETVNATVRNGLLTPVYEARKSLPEYLVLIERRSLDDQLAQLEDDIIRRLGKNGVFIDRFYFQEDPRLCRKDEPRAQYFSLQELAARYPVSNLIIFGDSSALFDPITGQPREWIEAFSPWSSRALLTLEPYENEYAKYALSELGILVLPASKVGMITLGELINTEHGTDSVLGNFTRPLPLLLQERPSRWLDSYPPPEKILEQLCVELREYLGDEGYSWLQACAHYPMPNWNVALYLGAKFIPDTVEKNLWSLMRLPWFTHGTMPDWLRERLISELRGEQKLLILEKLDELLRSSLLQEKGFPLTYVKGEGLGWIDYLRWFKWKIWWGEKNDLWELVKANPVDSPAREYVVASLVSKFKHNPLTLRVPEEVRSRIFDDESTRQQYVLRVLMTAALFFYLLFTVIMGAAAGRDGVLILIFGVVTTAQFATVVYYIELLTMRLEITASSAASPFWMSAFNNAQASGVTDRVKVDQPGPFDDAKHVMDKALSIVTTLPALVKARLDHLKLNGIRSEVKEPAERSEPREGTTPSRLYKYRIVRVLRHQAFSETYLAFDTESKRQLVLTVYKSTGDSGAEAAASWLLGLQLQQKLAGATSHVPKVYEISNAGETSFASMEYISGTSLADILRENKMSYTAIIGVATQLCETLKVAHSLRDVIEGREYKGVIHGDIKPANVLLGDDGTVYLLDFSIAQALSGQDKFTRNDFGTVAYCSPERLASGMVDVWSDLWSVGVLLYEMISGKLPFEADSPGELEEMINTRNFSVPLPKECPATLKEIVGKALAIDINLRYQSAGEMQTDLETLKLDATNTADSITIQVHNEAEGRNIRSESATGGMSHKHPNGLYVLFTAELWERFSFYSMLAMFTLYLRDDTEGFGWTAAEATSLYANYLMFVYLSPLVGGFIADLMLGYRRSVMLGSLFFIAGYLLLSFSWQAGVYVALTCLVIGNGFFKPNVSTMVGNLYPEGSHLKDRAYNIFYMGINVGAFLAPLVAGWVRAKFGFHPAFAVAAGGMVISVWILLQFKKHIHEPERNLTATDVSPHSISYKNAIYATLQGLIDAILEWKRIVALCVVFAVAIVFWMVFHQNASTLTYFADANTDWTAIFSPETAAESGGIFSNSIGPFWVITLTFPLVWFWGFLDKRGLEPSTPTKMAFGMTLTALSFFILYFAAKMGEATALGGDPYAFRVSPMWLVLSYFVVTLGELMLSPMGLSLVSKVAPIRLRGLMMGGWFVATAMGNKLTQIGVFWDRWLHSTFFLVLGLMALVMAVVLFLLLKPLKKAMPGV